MKLNKKYFAIGLSIALILVLSSLINIVNPHNILNSPDEASNYVTMKEYANSGKMYLQGNYLDQDTNNLLHQRGFLTWGNKIVPFSFLGFPLIFGPLYNFLGENIMFVLKIVYILSFLFLIYKFYFLIYKKNNYLILTVSFIFITQVIFYLNFFYFNIIPDIIFFLFFLYYLFSFNNDYKTKNLYLSALFACISIFFRYESIIFVLLVLLTNLLTNRNIYSKIKHKIRAIIILIIIILAFFVLPMLVLNYQLYGNPLTYGHSLFNKIYFPTERTGSILKTITQIIFPSQVFNIPTFSNNLKVILFLISPLFFTLAYLGILKTGFYKKVWAYFLIIGYFLIYNGMNPTTYLSGSSIVTSTLAVLRYWLILFPLILIPFAYYLKNQITNKNIKILILAFLIVYSIIFLVVLDSTASAIKNKEYFNNQNLNKNSLSNITNLSDYLITSTNGKIYYDQINIISWWGGATQSESDKFFNPEAISTITKFLILQNHSVYYLSDSYNFRYIPLLENKGLTFEEVPQFAGLYKISIKP